MIFPNFISHPAFISWYSKIRKDTPFLSLGEFSVFLFFFPLRLYLFIWESSLFQERKSGREHKQGGVGEAGSLLRKEPDIGIMTWAKGRHLTTVPLRQHPPTLCFLLVLSHGFLSYLTGYNSCQSYFNVQIVPDLASGNSFKPVLCPFDMPVIIF